MVENHAPLAVDALYRGCEFDGLAFETTDDLEDLKGPLGQERALEAIAFGTGIRKDGYNIYALGPSGTGKHEVIRRFLEPRASDEDAGSDWAYLFNFEEADQPKRIELPPGRAGDLRKAMNKLVENLTVAIPAAFETEDYRTRRQAIDAEFGEKKENAFKEIHDEAEERNLVVMRTPVGLILLPKLEGEVLSPEAFNHLPDDQREVYEKDIDALQERLKEAVRRGPEWDRQRRERTRELNRERTSFAVHDLLAEITKQFEDLPHVLTHLKAVEEDIVEKVDAFIEHVQSAAKEQDEATNPIAVLGTALKQSDDMLARYSVNVIIDRSGAKGAPVIYESNPSLGNLVGRVDHRSVLGALVTDFGMIRAGALHRANGGYLILDARKVLTSPGAWEGLKRALRAKEIRIESVGQLMSMVSTVSLDPEPIPLDVRVILVGAAHLYYLLEEHDPDFATNFKVAADFESEMKRNEGTTALFARKIATTVREDGLRPFDRGAVARVIEHSARQTGRSDRLSAHMDSLLGLLQEADHRADLADNEQVTAADVDCALEARYYRGGRIRDRVWENIERGAIKIDTTGAAVGQANGLSVLRIGGNWFGQPSRITARVRLGKGRIIDIEREADLGGNIHSKGVLILSGLLGARYAPDFPLALSASLVFEQSYGGVDGDSASLAEFCTLLSAITGIPLRQDIAVTGSINQFGEVQAVGGVNDKIEGFFEICGRRGLTGTQGVIIPASNATDLMLADRVRVAAQKGEFSVYPAASVDDALALLTGLEPGAADDDGRFPEGSFNRQVADRLQAFANRARSLASKRDEDEE